MIIDGHVHLFPYIGSACGYGSAEAHLEYMRKYFIDRRDVSFRAANFGRFEWTIDGIDYYRQFNPPSLQDHSCTPEFILAQMDHAGVDMAVLHNGRFYGKLNQYFSECVRKYPDKFVGMAEIDELQADRESEKEKLRHAVETLELKGLYYETQPFFASNAAEKFHDKKYDLFWETVRELGIAVNWVPFTVKDSKEQLFMKYDLFDRWVEKYPEIPCILLHGLFPLKPFMQNDELIYPKEFLRLFRHPNVHTEVLFPVLVGPLGWDYPYPQAHKIIQNLYEEIGAEKLVWGTDMPLVECNCTYKQALTYLRDYCDFIPPEDMNLILGDNARRIFNIDTQIAKTIRSRYAGGIY